MAEERVFTEEDIGMTFTIATPEGTMIEQEIVQCTCMICGESMIGTIGGAGGFLARHNFYHEHEMQLARVVGQ